MPDRRYTDAEVAEIFRRATEEPMRLPSGSDGLSLTELKGIGREVGIPEEQVVAAARSLDAVPQRATTTLFGLPVGVAETVVLDRPVSDAEWNELVTLARQDFRATGRLRQDGAFRQWSNGNLQLLLEPNGDGHQLRMRTDNGYARRMMLLGTAGLALSAVLFGVPLLTGVPVGADQLQPAAILGLAGTAMLGRGLWGLRAWAERRRQQFRELGQRLTKGR